MVIKTVNEIKTKFKDIIVITTAVTAFINTLLCNDKQQLQAVTVFITYRNQYI